MTQPLTLQLFAAILSSNADAPIDEKTCFAAEVGLSGEIRPVKPHRATHHGSRKTGLQKHLHLQIPTRKAWT